MAGSSTSTNVDPDTMYVKFKAAIKLHCADGYVRSAVSGLKQIEIPAETEFKKSMESSSNLCCGNSFFVLKKVFFFVSLR